MERIAGLVCLEGCSDGLHTQPVREMCNAQAHQEAGAGRQRVVTMAGACLGVVYVRKSDVADADSQPIHKESSNLSIVFDGTIYNRAEFREELSQRGHVFQSAADTELVLRAFEEWGKKCVDRLEGLFAFAIYDRATNALILARDRYGMKPLYYTIQGRHIYFASEIKPLISKLCRVNANRKALIEWSLYRSVLNPGDLIQGIYSVPPGHLVEFQKEQVASSCYYSPIAEVDADVYKHYAKAPWQTVVTELSETVDRSIQDCLTGDAPVGTLLSGGIDSSMMTALAARKRDIIALNVSVPEDPSMDERGPAEEVARLLDVPFLSRPLTKKAFLQALPQTIYLTESPLTHIQCVAFYFGAQLARENDVEVLLVGDAADTVLGGNWSRQQLLLRVGKLFARLPSRLRKALQDASSSPSVVPVRPFFNPEGVDLLDSYSRQVLRAQCEEAYRFITDSVDRSILTTKLVHLVEDVSWYLQRGDRLGMAQSVEYRTPFLDHRLIKMALNLPWRYQTCGLTDKPAFRQAASKYLPRRVAYRKKVPWDLPLQDYLSPFASPWFFAEGVCSDLFGLSRKAIDTITEANGSHPQTFFSLVNLELWGRLFLLKQPIEHVEEFVLKIQAEQR
jgi:asparagine synthase (glutamine-hydrolysing)